MYVIVVGCGKVGSNLAKELADEGHDIVIIDNDPEKFRQLGTGFNGKTVVGVPVDEDILRKAGIEKADAVAAVTPDENMNVMVSQIAKEVFKVPRVIPRVYDPDRDLIFQQLGLNTMCITSLAVARVKSILTQKSGDIWNTFGHKNVSFKYVTPDNKFIGNMVKNIGTAGKFLIFGIVRDDDFFLAYPELKIEKSDTLVIAEYV